MPWDLLTAVSNRSSPSHLGWSGPFCFSTTTWCHVEQKRSRVEAPQGVTAYRHACPSRIHSSTLPEWKYRNLESHALRVTCQIPFTGLCYVTNICHRLSQTPHLRVKNANPGWRRCLVKHQMLNQSEKEKEDGICPELLASLACTYRAEWCWRGQSMAGDSQCYRAELILVQPPFLSAVCGAGLRCVHHRPSLVWETTLALTLDNLTSTTVNIQTGRWPGVLQSPGIWFMWQTKGTG